MDIGSFIDKFVVFVKGTGNFAKSPKICDSAILNGIPFIQLWAIAGERDEGRKRQKGDN